MLYNKTFKKKKKMKHGKDRSTMEQTECEDK